MLRWAWLAGLLCLSGTVFASEVFPARGSIEVAFEPHDDAQALILRVIDQAQHSLRVQAYIFTSQPIAKALVAAHQRGVEVMVLLDAKMNQRGSGKAVPLLQRAGVPLAYETAYAAAHNKLIIADEQGPGCAVLTGSYNFSWSASQRNAENVVVMRGQCELAQAFADNWRRHYAQAQKESVPRR